MAFNLTLRTTKGNRLTFTELDNNFLYLKDRDIVSAGIIGSDLVLTKEDGGTFSVPLSGITASDTYITGTTFNNTTYDLTLNRNDGGSITQNLAALASDVYVLSGVYQPTTGVVEFTNTTGGTFNVSGFTTGMTNYYTTSANLTNKTISFDRTDTSNAYDVNLSGITVDKYSTTSGFTQDITKTITHNFGLVGDGVYDISVKLRDITTNEEIGGSIDNFTSNSVDITLSQTLTSVRVVIIG